MLSDMEYQLEQQHQAGHPIECLSIPIVLKKQVIQQVNGCESMRCGFRIGGGIDQDPAHSPHGYKDKGIYVTHISDGGPAQGSGLQVHDKILQVNGYDFTMVTHSQAVKYIQKFDTLKMLVTRDGVPQINL